MASKTRQVILAVKARLQTIAGGSYTYDLSGTDAVKGHRSRPEDSRLPAAWVSLGTLDSDDGPQLGGFRRDLVIDIEGRCQPASQDPQERALAAADLLQDITTALEADRRLGGLILGMKVTGCTVDGDEVGMGSIGIVYCQCSVYWHARSGEGV